MSSSRNALLCMAGSSARQAPPRQGTNRPNSALGSNVVKGPFVGAEGAKSEGGDVIDIHVARSGGWWLPFFLGLGAGVAGSVAFYRWTHPPKNDPPSLLP